MLSRAQDQWCVILIRACAVDRRFSAPNWSLPSLSSMHSKIHAPTKDSIFFAKVGVNEIGRRSLPTLRISLGGWTLGTGTTLASFYYYRTSIGLSHYALQ